MLLDKFFILFSIYNLILFKYVENQTTKDSKNNVIIFHILFYIKLDVFINKSTKTVLYAKR